MLPGHDAEEAEECRMKNDLPVAILGALVAR
jgi:hypothetical protein